ncbi:MAG: DUF302 domain-containing protein [Longimicrobiales bacterium]
MDVQSQLEAAVAGRREQVVERVTDALKEEGFGVLTRIDIDHAFDEKLGVEFRPYTILGACNPGLAHKVLSARPDAGLLLPCNVVVDEEQEGQSLVRILDPLTMFSSSGYQDDAAFSELANEARDRLVRVADQLAAG